MSEVKELKDSLELQLKAGFDGLQKKYDAAMDEVQKGNQVTTDLKKQIEDQKGELQKVIDQVVDLEQKGVKLRGQPGEGKSFIDLIKGDESYKSLNQKNAALAQLEVTKSDMASMKEMKVTSAGIVAPVYDPVIQPGIRQELRIRDLLTSIPVTGQQYTYFREKLHTRGAAPVAEGGLKPTSNVTFEPVTDRVKKLAVWMPVTDEALDDVPQMFAYLQQLLRYDLKLEEEAQILKGDGTGENLPGLMTQATTYDTALSKAGDTAIDLVRRAIYQVRKQSQMSADGTVMTELDWMNIELQKDGENRYLFANLQGLVTPILWGRPVITSDSMDEGDGTNGGEFLVANFARSTTLFDRMSFVFKMGLINDQFIKNERALLVEERLGLGVRRKEALVKGRFPTA
ncbi:MULTISPECIES: phage major capsid protein [Pseudomonas]|jgi:HK97 family phage major capsid protein|uniref:Phage major capsid protein n=1 Tax=Pseudomonas asiatica TaxID=2219225 RepID=A0A9X4D345_9PSED|nr:MULTISPECIES: phage major capsid protein [Pseudomonas]AGA74896.1 HK97 family phage major capsid protein [Pseudomonas putida HB3267]AYO01518.1 phage major capsid protein [Pseudomonas sp. LTGT-11-2Z]MCE0757287.1 phage major capsid protein [Pseudomonas asiatica]MCE0853892.1 phage major capsid protein [Pseudomonas asiatica]MCE0946629.1 phage major capsid protein [Pseudomonas asiatica]